MTDNDKGTEKGFFFRISNNFPVPIAHKIILSFLVISLVTNVIFTVAGIRLMANRIVAETQDRVRNDLNAAREIYLGEARHINDVIRLTARRPIIPEALTGGLTDIITNDLINVRVTEDLDFLTLTDQSGIVVLRTSNPASYGDRITNDVVIDDAIKYKESLVATTLFSREQLMAESPELAARAQLTLIDTPMARPLDETKLTSGMALVSVSPVFDDDHNFIGILYGGVLLNKNYALVDLIKQTVFQNVVYKGKDIGTATIFQNDVRISTNVLNTDGTRAIGTRIAEDVYNKVIVQGEPWIGRAYVVNNWYITAYEPIRNVTGSVIGILYVGILEQKYLDIRNQAILAFIVISAIGLIFTILISYFISRSISVPVNKLVVAAKDVASGNLEAKVEKTSNDEIGLLADAFNSMALALRARDEQLKEFTRKKFMESERLALIGQLAANVAHELNNPLQGIVTYSHLLIERNTIDDPVKQTLQKIVVQANRSRDIIRGLLDFSRQRKPDKTLCNINNLLDESYSFLENQALMHNIEIIRDLASSLPSIVIDPSQVQRVFINMMVNAAEAMNGNGRLTLTTRQDANRECIEITFADTGMGISGENLEKIFDPFFTTKETGHGVGLGLAISYGIIKEHGGTISVESELGKGTTFIVRLPLISVKVGVQDGQ